MTTNAAPDLKEKENVSKVHAILVSVARTLESVLWQQTNVAQEVIMELFKIQNKPNNFHCIGSLRGHNVYSAMVTVDIY